MTFVPHPSTLPILEIFGEKLCLWYYRRYVKNENARWGIPDANWSEERAHYLNSCCSCYDRIMTAASPRVYADWDTDTARSGVDFL